MVLGDFYNKFNGSPHDCDEPLLFMIIVYNNPLRLSRLCYKRLIVLELLYVLLFAELAY